MSIFFCIVFLFSDVLIFLFLKGGDICLFVFVFFVAVEKHSSLFCFVCLNLRAIGIEGKRFEFDCSNMCTLHMIFALNDDAVRLHSSVVRAPAV